jgi:hypothetical protein
VSRNLLVELVVYMCTYAVPVLSVYTCAALDKRSQDVVSNLMVLNSKLVMLVSMSPLLRRFFKLLLMLTLKVMFDNLTYSKY